MAHPLTKETEVDGFFAFDAGVHTGLRPSLLAPNQLAHAVNCTVRGGYVSPRPPIRKRVLDFGGDTLIQHWFQDGRFQGAMHYQPDSCKESLLASVGGHLFRITPDDGFKVQHISTAHTTQVAVDFVVPAAGFSVSVQVVDTGNLVPNTPILIDGKNYVLLSVDSGVLVTVENVDATAGDTVSAGAILTFFDVNPATLPQAWGWQAERWAIFNDGQSGTIVYDNAQSRRTNPNADPPEISCGRMGLYWQGRNWWANPDGRTYRSGDVVYSSTGTGDRRDAVLKQSQNTFLAQGGNFAVPSNAGFIKAMAAVNVLDTSLGQGPLQVLTPQIIFGCNASLDDSLWQTTTNPLQSVSQIAFGGLSQWSTVLVNGDMFYRSSIGIHSLVIGRRDVSGLGNTPISLEVSRYLDPDDKPLLEYSSAVLFDNRLLMTCAPAFTNHGVYHRGLVALNFDVVSAMSGKKPAVWEGLWTGAETVQVLRGSFGGIERCFAFVFNAGTSAIELYEILPATTSEIKDNNGQDIPIRWAFETPDIFRELGLVKGQLSRLIDGELYLDDLIGTAVVRVLWRPDQYPCWTEWHRFTVCAEDRMCSADDSGCLVIEEKRPQYRTSLGLGEPPGDCDPITNSPFRVGYTFALRIEVQGRCRILGGRFAVVPEPNPVFAEMICD
jgi:hypothetical protein